MLVCCDFKFTITIHFPSDNCLATVKLLFYSSSAHEGMVVSYAAHCVCELILVNRNCLQAYLFL